MKNKYTKEQIQQVKDILNESAFDYINDGMGEHGNTFTTLEEFYEFAKGIRDDEKVLRAINSPKCKIETLNKYVKDLLGYTGGIDEMLELV